MGSSEFLWKSFVKVLLNMQTRKILSEIQKSLWIWVTLILTWKETTNPNLNLCKFLEEPGSLACIHKRFCCDYEMLKTKYHFPNRQNSRHRIYEIPSVCFFTSIRVKKRCKHDSPLSKEKPWQRAINHRPRNIRMTLNLNLTIAKMRGRTACQIIRLIFHFSQDFNNIF